MNKFEEAKRRLNLIVQNGDHTANGVNIGNVRPAFLRHCDIAEIRTALTQAAEIERGDKVVVPREPTDEMVEAGYSAGDGARYAGTIYKAMLAASGGA